MIIVAAHVRTKAGQTEAFAAEAKQCVDKTRHESGCISYTLYRSAEDGDAFMIFEEWESQAHLDAHMKSAHFAAFMGASQSLTEGLSVDIYEGKKLES